MRYPWHPWHGKEVEVRSGERYRGVVRCFVPEEERRAKLLPMWMLDEATCARMHTAEVGCVSVAALEALLRLLAETATVDAAVAPFDATTHESAIEETTAAAGADGAEPGNSSLGGAARGLPPRGGRSIGEASPRRKQPGGRGGR